LVSVNSASGIVLQNYVNSPGKVVLNAGSGSIIRASDFATIRVGPSNSVPARG
jgi:hypothetical protein